MTQNLYEEWAAQWGVSALALADLRQRLSSGTQPNLSVADAMGKSEAAVSERLQLEAARIPDVMLWRNNVGAMQNETGRVVRFGLANDSKEINSIIKSADLIGIHRRRIVASDVGTVIGQVLSPEVKREDWKMPETLDKRTVAQMRWRDLIISYGGRAVITNGSTGIRNLIGME